MLTSVNSEGNSYQSDPQRLVPGPEQLTHAQLIPHVVAHENGLTEIIGDRSAEDDDDIYDGDDDDVDLLLVMLSITRTRILDLPTLPLLLLTVLICSCGSKIWILMWMWLNAQ